MLPGARTVVGWTREQAVFHLNVTGPWGVIYVDPAHDPRKQ
jgi:hypothetical protein